MFFKKSVSAADLGECLGEVVVNWPSKYGAQFKADYGAGFQDVDGAIDEIVYFLAFGSDYAIFIALKDSPNTVEAVRKSFGRPVGSYAIEHECPALMRGDWMDDGWIWMPQDMPDEVGNPISNLNDRNTQYAAALKRASGQKMSLGETTAHLLAGWCMNLDVSFLLYASSLFSEHVIATKTLVEKFRVVA